MWEPENILVASQEWHNHHDDWYWQEGDEDDDRVTYCELYECSECPRYGDDCDGNGEDEDDD